MERFFDFMRNYSKVEEDTIAFIKKYAEEVKYPEGEYFIRPDESMHYWCFVLDGLVQGYTLDRNGKQRIPWFAIVNQDFSGTKHLYTKSNENLYIQFAKPTHILRIRNERLLEAKRKYPEISELLHVMKQQLINRQKDHAFVLLRPGATAQLITFKKYFKDLFYMLSPEQLAAHLNLSLASIYRALNEMSGR